MTTVVTTRASHYAWLHSALGKTKKVPGSLFIWGPRSSGKKYVVNKVLSTLKIRCQAHVSGEELLSGHRSFLETILRQLGGPGDAKCENGRMFLRHLKTFLSSLTKLKTYPAIVVIYHAELLRNQVDILHTFLNAQDYIRQNVCFVLCSTLPWDSFHQALLKDTQVLHFQQYKRDELKMILTARRQKLVPRDIYTFYANTVVDYFITCRDLRKLTRLVISQIQEFSTHLNSMNKCDQSNLRKLFRIIEPKLKDDFKNMNVRMAPVNPSGKGSLKSNDQSKLSILNAMPLYSKYILIAAYIASHNPASSDRRYFVRGRASRKRTKENATSFPSPQMFTIVRLLAITASLNKEVFIPMDSVIRSQITTLCTAGLLVRSGDDLGDCKFKCLAGLDLIKLVSGSVNFEIEHYLCQPV